MEVSNAMVWAGIGALYTFDREHDDEAEIVMAVFRAMRERELGEKAGRTDLGHEPVVSPFRFPS